MNSRKAVYLLLAAAVVISFFSYNYLRGKSLLGQDRIMRRAEIDATSFTREDALGSLAQLESASTLSFSSSLNRKKIDEASLPEELKKLVVPAENETVVFEKDAQDAEIYFVSYFSDVAMPESHSRFIRLADPLAYKFLSGSRNGLASIVVVASAGYKIKVSQLAVSEERTEVMILAEAK